MDKGTYEQQGCRDVRWGGSEICDAGMIGTASLSK